jgi:PleD family two-component response regulator
MGNDGSRKPLRILILEDRPVDAELVIRELRKAGLEFVPNIATTETEFLDKLRDQPPQLILADYSLPGYDGLSALAAAQEQCPETPFIFVSSALGEERAIETLHRGATDYVLENRLARLGLAVRRALRKRDETRMRKEADQQRLAAETSFHKLFEQSPEGIVVVDPATARFLEFSDL